MRLFLLALCLALVPGCDIVDPMDETGETFEGMAAVGTDDPSVPAVAVHEDGEMLAALADPATGAVTGAVFLSNALSEPVIVSFGPDGMPQKLVMGDEVVLFENVRDGLVDVVYVAPDGQLQVARDLPFDADFAGQAAARLRAGKAGSTMEAIGAARLGVSIATCSVGLAVVAGAIITTGPLGLMAFVATGAGCTSAVLTVAQLYQRQHGTSDDRINETALEWGRAANLVNGVTCAGGDLGGCLETSLLVVEVVADNAEAALERLRDAVERAAALLLGGGGDVQVSLSWDTTADLDLWVTDPAGERIYYAHRASASGGQLDVDDIDGFGPENIFWPTDGAPGGSYTVQVDHFSGASPSSYRVQTVIAGTVRTFTGTVSFNQTDDVTTFTIAGTQPGPSTPPAPPTAWAQPPKD